MQTTLRKLPSDPWQGGSDHEIVLADGTHGPVAFASGTSRVTIRAENPGKATISGALRSGGHAEFAVRVNDGCEDITLIGLVITAGGHGLKVTKCQRLRLSGCRFEADGVEGAIVGFCDQVLVEDCTFASNGAFSFGGYPEDRDHGLYISEGSTEVTVRRCRFVGNSGSGLQLNATIEDGNDPITGALVEECVFERNGSGGTPAISLISVQESTFRNLYFRANNAGVTLFQTEDDAPCSGNGFALYTFDGSPGKWDVKEEGSSRGKNRFNQGKGWNPAAPPSPPVPATKVCPTCGGSGRVPA